jgi:hypothetical protein
LRDLAGRTSEAKSTAEVLELTLDQHLACSLSNWVKQPANAATLVANRTERKREKGFFQIAVAVQKHALVFEVRCLASHRAFKCLADGRPG